MRYILALALALSTTSAALAKEPAKLIGKAPPIQTPAPKAKPLTQAAAASNPVMVLQGLSQFAVTDLTAALADANSQTPPDTVAAMCYTELLSILNGNTGFNPFPTTLGAFSLLQKGRDLKTLAANLQSTNGPLSMLNVACAPLVIDTQNTLIQLGILGGVVIK